MRSTEPFCSSPTTNDAETPAAAPTAFTAWRPTPVTGTAAESLAVGTDMSTHCSNDLAAEIPLSPARGGKQLEARGRCLSRVAPRRGGEQAGGVALAALAASASAEGGEDYTNAPQYWSRAELPRILGTPDANGDGIPDVWVVSSDGKQYLFPGGTATLPGAPPVWTKTPGTPSWQSASQSDPAQHCNSGARPGVLSPGRASATHQSVPARGLRQRRWKRAFGTPCRLSTGTA